LKNRLYLQSSHIADGELNAYLSEWKGKLRLILHLSTNFSSILIGHRIEKFSSFQKFSILQPINAL